MTCGLFLGSGVVNGMDKAVCLQWEGGGGPSHTTVCAAFKAGDTRNPIGFNWVTGNEKQLSPFAS